MPEPRETVAAEIDAHTSSGMEGCVHCWCGEWFESFREHSAHVAEAVLAALGLRQEWSEQNAGGYQFGLYVSQEQAQSAIDRRARMYPEPKPSHPCSRFVTPWVQT